MPSELRKDPLSQRWVIIAAERAKRPSDFEIQSSEAAPAFPLAAAAMAPLRAKAEGQGSGDFSPLWSGQNNSRCKETSAGLITQELAADL